MPEIAEVARIVHFIRKHLVGKTLNKVSASHDDIVFGKVGTSAAEFEKAMTGKKVVDAGQQGKYFWMIMDSPPHPVMHFGMAGWLKMKSEHTYYYKSGKSEAEEEWPPKYWKFLLETKEEPTVDAAFVDFRRLSRIRLVDCDGKQIRKNTPLKENGPDPVQDPDIVTEEWLVKKCRSKKVPIKALLLDQANISGIGNWVGDEIMYNAKIHPEQYSNTLTDDQLKQLHESIHYICKTSCDLLGDSDRFPEGWLFKHRWGKGKKDSLKTLPNGEKIVFLTVGGRTSAVIPSVQKKTGPVAKEIDEADSDEGGKKSKGKSSSTAESKKRKINKEDEEEKNINDNAKLKATKLKRNKTEVNDISEEKKAGRGTNKAPESKEKKPLKSEKVKQTESATGRRRSGRLGQN